MARGNVLLRERLERFVAMTEVLYSLLGNLIDVTPENRLLCLKSWSTAALSNGDHTVSKRLVQFEVFEKLACANDDVF